MKMSCLKHTKKVFCAFAVLLTCSVTSYAQNADIMFSNMPDTIMSYLIRDKLSSEIIPTYFGKNVKKVLGSDGHLTIIQDSSIVMQIVPLPLTRYTADDKSESVNADSVFCVLRSVSMPERDTEITIRDSKWNIIQYIDFHDWEYASIPDPMSIGEYKNILNSSDLKMVEAEYIGNHELKLCLSIPILCTEDKTRLNNVFLQRNVKWNGKTFK